MDEGCVRGLTLDVAKGASATMATPTASPDEKAGAHGCNLGASCTKDLMRAATARMLSGLTRRSLADPATTELAKKLRAGLHEVGGAVGGEVDAAGGEVDSLLGENV